MGRFFAYMRISTPEEKNMQKFDRQIHILKKYADANKIDFIVQFKEDASGKNFVDRKEWHKLEQLLGDGDTVVFSDISRFTREAENGYLKYTELMNKGVELIFVDNPSVSTPYIRRMLNLADNANIITRTTIESTVKIMILMELDRVEQERKIFIERVKAGMAASNKQIGRPKANISNMPEGFVDDARRYMNDRSIKAKDLCKKYGVCLNTFKKYLNIIRENDLKENADN